MKRVCLRGMLWLGVLVFSITGTACAASVKIGIIDVQKGEFELLKENQYTAEYTSPPYTLGTTGGNINAGGKYETYLVVISGPDGNVISHRSGRSIKDEGVALIRTMGKETMFDRDGNILGQLENKGEALKVAIPAAMELSGGRGSDDN